MTAKEYLERIKLRDEQINQKLHELEDLQRRRTVISAVDYSKEKLSGSRSEVPFEKFSDKIIDLIAEINREIDAFSADKHNIINQIQGLGNSRFMKILYKRYVEYMDFGVIADEVGYTYQYVIELHACALRLFEITYKNLLQF